MKSNLTPTQAKALIDAMVTLTDGDFCKDNLIALVNAISNQARIETLYDQVFRPHMKYEAEIEGIPLSPRDFQVIEYLWKKSFEHLQE